MVRFTLSSMRTSSFAYSLRLWIGRRCLSELPSADVTLSKFHFPKASHTINQISHHLDNYLHKEIVLNGHLNRKPRIMAKYSFAELRDCNGDIVQLILSPDNTDSKYFDILKQSIPEESISVTGKVQLKETKDNTEKWELLVNIYQVLNESNLNAARLENLKHTNPDNLPPQFRYLQLRGPSLQRNLKTRSQIAHMIRNLLISKHDFTEIETPLLFKSTPEGAREFLVPTRSSNSFYALPQSPQQYKQILMSAGFVKYFQIAKCFRDEDLRSDRQPEFTQVDLEMSFISSTDQIQVVVEEMIYNIITQVRELPVYVVNKEGYLTALSNLSSESVYFTQLTYLEALSLYGIDKPDLRSNLSFVDLSDFLRSKNPDFPVLEACILTQGLIQNKIPKNLTNLFNYSRRKPYIVAIKDQEDVRWYNKFLEKQVFEPSESFDPARLDSLLGLKVGDIIAISDRAELPYENPTPLGRFRQLAIVEYPDKWQRQIQLKNGETLTTYDSSQVFVASWITEFPLFSPIEIDKANHGYPQYRYQTYESTHHPFTMANTEDYHYLDSNPLKVRGDHYDLVINGVEVGGGSRRIHDPKLQEYILKNILRIGNYKQLFGHLLASLSMGCPPHAGLAIGFDRLCAMMVGSSSIRDIIAFPKNQSGIDPVVDSPSNVDKKTLEEYFLKSLP